MNDIMEDILKWSKNELLQNWFRDEEIFLKSFLKDKNIETVLDVGCGTGRTIDFLLSNFKFKKIVGIEKNPDLVKYLKEKYSKYNSVEIGWTNIIFPEKSYYKLDEKFDLVLCMGNTLGTILNWKLGLKRILERSKKYVILSVYDNMKSIETRKKVYESLGFKIKSIGINQGTLINEDPVFYNVIDGVLQESPVAEFSPFSLTTFKTAKSKTGSSQILSTW